MTTPTHNGLVIVAPRAPYEIHQFPTISPVDDEIRVHVKWTASTPLDLHQADGGLLIETPFRTGSTSAGIVVEVGPNVKHLRVSDRVIGFAHQQPKWKSHQEYATAPEWVFGKIPDNLSMEEAVTIPENFVTAFNAISTDLGLPTPWPKPKGYIPPRADDPILIWGAASSKGDAPAFPLIVDCIGSQDGSVGPISKIAQSGTTVAIMLPVIVKHATETDVPEYSMDASTSAQWADGVNVRGVRTFFYWRNPLFKEKLQLEIMPYMLAAGHVVPNRIRVVEGRTLLERATKALELLRTGGVSGEKLVWRVSEE
ncbi:hypothetical protein GL218_05024 [Daldinia childiae]|uniref:uncharacterized protein n=1 Tax=Daldinia childiae TaxID=326645 RepID=UPI0014462F7B|nr:uncharacterized protein GL218_05024 [Daldinia childiae]KAF3059334.1 hypothetical protein GL218_05024 [Daldinia childiae]